MREPPPISEEQLRACLQAEYGLTPITLQFLPRGHDYNAGVYRVVSEQGIAYLCKLKAGPLNQASCLVPRYLADQGIASVVAPIRTANHALWTTRGNWTVILYPFIEGDTSPTGMTSEQWMETGAIFRRIHDAPLPAGGFPALRQETFDPSRYARWVYAFESEHLNTHEPSSIAERVLHASWLAHRPTIALAVASLEKLGKKLHPRALPLVICHADLHPANLLRDPGGPVHVIDWDDVMLAPRERDFIFIREPEADAFWEGYQPGEIDWTALTYFRWERIVGDFIETARLVCFRGELSEETKADIAWRFEQGLAAEGSHMLAVRAAEAHLAGRLDLFQT